ncbi:beta-galactosidase/beta-glucuronidase [Parabacteroides sp. PF5-5]|uniref:glycoside hydrolase family 2 protein n=1 Tax=unclassified Parabacteroides TaxID=2649774 RepID=UPI0024752716|nr:MULTISPECIES: sugar-binding domain-containing protein [unclassified Parabacteroides]MDH6306969.1 beta-galactosidase/beta-glucuronidase [Parabacteroides sp. PH5-39]MDH6317843.1 beta-galactosidase/beta-glucuronidase [Parabacteroides sp. PF5-13]MDH6321574.1 beta-galactosidase/beta-glucuronidase [Parabacteroides sp. PH5-13]MDH6325350.1 beta-galactosidase/beta-glucuronidase [Parabacteroides sp. PH5-8]MDH6329021.1 beta-galactosidase/beta-glucuronidase [Parabacteroides sp. PH5-41]
MRKVTMLICALVMALGLQAQWKPAGDKIKTDWAEKIDPNNVLPEYPRPLIERSEWTNLNGLWDYAIATRGAAEPSAFDGKILVPFAIESSLSGVMKEVGETNELWYKREFTVPSAWKGKNVKLNFGAVDWKADVFVNDILIGSHQGGYTPFSFDITPFLSGKTKHKLVVRVWDPTDKGFQPRGKQVKNPESIWYTPVTGIWQTVWLEPVAPNHITAIKAIPCVDSGSLNVTVSTAQCCATDIVEVKLLDKGQVVASAKGLQRKELRLSVKNPTLWDTKNPYLYDMKVSVSSAGKVVDEIKSYTAFRKISAKRDANGLMRMQLNNKDLFHYGPLDQGWWPDGLYTAPTDEALLYDIKKTKDWGFNMIRKHVKVEPARWYYHCDKEGILVWQDMPSGDMGNNWAPHVYNGGTDKKRSAESIANYYQEWQEIMDLCISNPSVVVWVPFNEAWGQFDTEKVTEWTATYDPSRLVNPASGGNHRPCGDILDLHNYPGPKMFLFDAERVNVLGEYGGIGLPLEEHLWWQKRNWGYIQFKNVEEVTAEYVKYAKELKEMVKRGFSAAVYTQTTDVEGEVNGLMTYDRKKIKINEAEVRKANLEVINELSK